MGNNSQKPFVAVWSLIYNHEPYLRDYFEGIIMQKTNFPFVAIVHDDCSTDGSAAIIREYAEKCPDIIKPIFETENQYSKKDGSLDRIMHEAINASGAKYIALCEGDDYWIDPLKLQKQVDFLESHPDYSMCFHPSNLRCENGANLNTELEHNLNNLEQREYSIDEILASWTVPTCSAVIRENVNKINRQDPDYIVGDNVLWTACAVCGKIFCINQKMATYRINGSGWTIQSNESRDKRIQLYKRWHKHYRALRKNFPGLNSKQIYKNEVNFAAKVTYTDIYPLKNFFKNFFGFLNKYGLYYLSIFTKSLIIFLLGTLKKDN